jgi:uncharacterized protein (DUF1330 family)
LPPPFAGKFVVRSGKFECPEGTTRSRNVVIEFPDYAAARLLRLAGIPGEHQAAAAAFDRRYRHYRGL